MVVRECDDEPKIESTTASIEEKRENRSEVTPASAEFVLHTTGLLELLMICFGKETGDSTL